MYKYIYIYIHFLYDTACFVYMFNMYGIYMYNNRIRISSNCIELIFGKGHLLTL